MIIKYILSSIIKVKAFILSLALISIIVSCQKYNDYDQLSSTKNLIADARKQFLQDSLKFYQTFDKQQYNYRQSLTRIIHWQNFKKVKNSLIIPITLQLAKNELNSITGKNTLEHKVFLVVDKDEDNKYRYKMVTFIGSFSQIFKEFTGTVYSEGYFKGDVQYNTYKKGKINKLSTLNLNQIDIQSQLKKNGLSTRSFDCNWTKVARVCVGDPTDSEAKEICGDKYEYQCNWNPEADLNMSFEDFNQGPVDPGGNGADINNYDCAGILYGNAYIGTCGVCIGGTTGITSCMEITHELDVYPCAKDLLEKLPNLKNIIAKLINDKFVGSDNYNILFRARKLGVSIDGEYNNNSLNMYNSTITLNTDILTNSSKEYILVTMYHEALHSFLNLEEKNLSQTAFNIKYPNLSKTNNGSMPNYYFAHDGFPSFIYDLADAIRSFNPSIPQNDALVLAKTGIVNNMTNTEKLINDKYRNGTYGTKCN